VTPFSTSALIAIAPVTSLATTSTPRAPLGTVTAYSFDLSGDLTDQSTLSATDITALEVQLLTDLNADSKVGVTVTSKLFDKERDASGNYSYDNDKRFLYSTSGGLILSTNSLMEGSDLRYSSSTMASSYDGPSRLLTERLHWLILLSPFR